MNSILPAASVAARLLSESLDDNDPLGRGPTFDAADRARRITAIYAAFYQLDPLCHGWCGLAAYAARRVRSVLDTKEPWARALLMEGNTSIYARMMPSFLSFRARRSGEPALGEALALLAEASRIARTDRVGAEGLAAEGTRLASRYEQGEVVQPVYDRLDSGRRDFIRRHLGFRLGRDSSAPLLICDGDGTDRDVRLAWMEDIVLPQWARLQAREPAVIKADMEHFRREGGLRLAELEAALAAPG